MAGYFGGTIDTAGGAITAADQSDAFAAALNPDGTIRWLTLLGADEASTVVPLADGNVLLGGRGELTLAGSQPPPADTQGQSRLFFLELDGAGRHVWSAYSGLPLEMQLGSDGALYVHGSIDGYHVDATPFHGGTLMSYGSPALTYESGVVVKMLIR
ncbi:MAG TPA: hypothetical protein VIF57_03980 [Polyangia bacterium]